MNKHLISIIFCLGLVSILMVFPITRGSKETHLAITRQKENTQDTTIKTVEQKTPENINMDLSDIISTIPDEKHFKEEASWRTAPIPTEQILHTVPFSSQAPFANWDVQIFQDGCEEASVVMAMSWVRGEETIAPEYMEAQIRAMDTFMQNTYGFHLDVSAQDTVKFLTEFFQHKNLELVENITVDELKKALTVGVIITPANGKILGNPNFSGEGPENHMLLITGYDPKTDEFITNDPGTKRGEKYRYKADVLYSAIRNYPSGYHLPHPEVDEKTIIIVRK